MIVFPNCKINLGLNVLNRRKDGYHNIETVFAPIKLCDILEIIPAELAGGSIEFSTSGIEIAGDPAANLCSRAYFLLKKEFPGLPPVKMHLHKVVPAGAGLGGGSADGAFTLRLINEKFNLDLSEKQLLEYALQLGSDCPFFIYNKFCFASGRGELLEPLQLQLNSYRLLIVNPGIHIPTAKAFGRLTPSLPAQPVNDIIRSPVREWKDLLKNDFEAPLFGEYPEIGEIKSQLYQYGAAYASMSGSGSTVYGLFATEIPAGITFPQHYFVKETSFL